VSEAAIAADTGLARRAVERLAFPLLFCGAVGLHAAALTDGGDPTATVAVATLGSMVVIALLERCFPHHQSWLHSHDDIRTDIAHALTIAVVSGWALSGSLIVGVAVSQWLGESAGLGLWPTTWPWLAQLPLALAIAELPKYWHHRLQHETDLLWRYHAVHHSAPRLYFLNAARFHPIDITIDTFLGVSTIVALGCPVELVALFGTASAVHGYFQHANLGIRIGWLNYVFSMAELHRWHHSKTVEEANHNYGQNLILWDLVFGTFYWPDDREPPEAIGIPDLPAFPMTYFRQQASPFTWRRIEQESRSSAVV
jgi:sterol desaturase/sphingolipid hydroxylase (fatty acid hydroxylase superfamily)